MLLPRHPRAPRHLGRALAGLCVLASGLLVADSPAQARTPDLAAAVAPASDAGLESQFVNQINGLRSSKGLSQLQVSGELQGVARRWTAVMVGAGQISHNPSLGSQVGGSWTKLGENVGVGYDIGGLMQAFINSPSHYKNLVDPVWTHVGVGVTVAGDGRIYTTHNFMALGGQAPPPPAPPPPPPAPVTTAPPPPTTAPPAPTTTTTSPPPPEPHPTWNRVTAVLDPLRSLERA